jgi:hypothetical protein
MAMSGGFGSDFDAIEDVEISENQSHTSSHFDGQADAFDPVPEEDKGFEEEDPVLTSLGKKSSLKQKDSVRQGL